MEMTTYLKAVDLIQDVNKINKYIEEVEKKQHWITVSTPDSQLGILSLKFQKDLVEWLRLKRDEYKKEFDELN